MNLIHVTPPEVNYYPMYSVEYAPEKSFAIGTLPVAWSQFGLTHNKWHARALAFEVWLRYGRTHRRRVRVL